jgi:outer membrane protein assembly factor BamD (BamD/ComL family)
MRDRLLQIFFIIFTCFSPVANAYAEFTFYKGKLVNVEEVPTMSPEDHFKEGKAALQFGDTDEAIKNFNIVINCFPKNPAATEAPYYIGIAHFLVEDYDFANEAFSDYLKKQANPKFFEQTLTYKMAIAEQFKQGAKKHMFGTGYMPKWAPAKELAIDIYNEIIAALPCHEMAVQAMFAKAQLQCDMGNQKQSIETFQLLTRRFPTHELAPEAFLIVNEIYYDQSLSEFQNPDILSLAQINCRKFSIAFPRDERVQKAENYVKNIKEVYAWGLYDTGMLYERKKHPQASIIYYRNALAQFPDTSVASLCQERLCALEKHAKKQG